MKRKTIAVVGGDLRQAHLANILAEKESGYKVFGMFLDQNIRLSPNVQHSNDIKLVFPQSDIVIFPLPMLIGQGRVNTPLSPYEVNIEDCFDYIPREALVMGGKVSQSLMELAEEKGIYLVDYLEREEFAVLNAVPTAEGAIEIALREIPTTLYGQTCLIVGYGRVGKVLASLLSAFGAKVKVVARKYSDLAWIRVNNCEAVPVDAISSQLPDVDVLFNTVPAVLLGENRLAKLKRSCLVIDLASKPGGVHFETAQYLGIKTIWALSLPGKVAPITAGEIILETIQNILHERGDCE